MPNEKQENFAQFSQGLEERLSIEDDEESLENLDLQKIHDLEEKRTERKRNLLFENLELILRHKDEIVNSPRYANIDVHYALQGGGAYIGPIHFQRRFNAAGTMVTVNLKLKSLLKIWENETYKVCCDCGATAYIRYFAGSPLSGASVATAYCPCCKKEIREIKGQRFSGFAGPVQNALDGDVAAFFQCFTTKAFDKEDLCSLEKLILELRLKEFEEASIRT